jgi:hypothetical protein
MLMVGWPNPCSDPPAGDFTGSSVIVCRAYLSPGSGSDTKIVCDLVVLMAWLYERILCDSDRATSS